MLMVIMLRSPPYIRSASVSAVSVLPTPLGPTSMKTPIGLLGSSRLALRGADALADHAQSVILADDAAGPDATPASSTVADFVLQHLADRNAGPGGDHVADDVGVDADAHQRRFALQVRPARHSAQLSSARSVSGSAAVGRFRRCHRWQRRPWRQAHPGFQLAANVADAVHQVALLLPARLASSASRVSACSFCWAIAVMRSAWSAPNAASRSSTRSLHGAIVDLAR